MRGTGGVWRVRDETGVVREASLRGRLKLGDTLKLAVGDEVELEPDERGLGAWAITAIHPRRSRLARRAPGGAMGERVVAANVDQVVVVFAAAQPEPHPRMLDRFLVIAAANDVPARLVINKIDLAPPGTLERFADYPRAGYPLHATSVRTGEGLAELHEALRGRVSALTGPSGVGKSSLLNAIYPGLSLRVGEISRSVNKGRHTTVGADMHPIPDGGYVMDTPGLREVGVWNIPPEELDACFIELRPLIGRCRFRDCRHRAEPECAVREAVEEGTVSRARYESYLKLLEELEQSARPW
ncbi:MAG TPA: ribosome small subunit-dependent GTPase A [Gemmatimonadaceae bacterium]|nr:ribosome small subunit-dependent GTPase A [Gemmatimonadaceae bacterium]